MISSLRSSRDVLYDVEYFSLSSLLSLLSTQLYVGLATTSKARETDAFGCDNLFLDCILLSAEHEFRAGLGRTVSRSDLQPVRLVRELLALVAQRQTPPTDSIVQLLCRATSTSAIANNSREAWRGVTGIVSRTLFFFGDMISAYFSRAPAVRRPSTSTYTSLVPMENNVNLEPSAVPLADRAASLLCLLLLNRASASSFNAMREAFCLLHDDRFAEFTSTSFPSSPSQPSLGAHFDYDRISEATSSLPPETFILLQYLLLQKHPSYLECIIANPDHSSLRHVTESLLRRLYLSLELRSVDVVYVLLIDLLLLLQESRVRQWMALERSPPRRGWDWYQERWLTNATLSDVAVLCVLKGLLFALFTWRDSYALSHCLALLVNLSSSMREMHAYTAERIVDVILKLGRRVVKEGAVQSPLRNTFELLMNFAAVVVGVEGGAVNANLLYALVYRHDALFSVLDNQLFGPRSAGAGSSSREYLLFLSDEYLTTLETLLARDMDAGRAIEHLRAHLSAHPVPPVPIELPASFAYEEGTDSESFFVPCVWAAATMRSPDLPLAVDRISIFDPIILGLVKQPEGIDSERNTIDYAV
jgi:hypothetical protein